MKLEFRSFDADAFNCQDNLTDFIPLKVSQIEFVVFIYSSRLI